jgi:hypothetical protein
MFSISKNLSLDDIKIAVTNSHVKGCHNSERRRFHRQEIIRLFHVDTPMLQLLIVPGPCRFFFFLVTFDNSG